LNLSANCTTRALTDVLLITPKVGEEKLLSGFANCGWLRALKNSTRNSRNYAVEYQLRAWANTSEALFDTYAGLRRNILDAFAEAGVEIMTPTILSHRDANEIAIPPERFPSRPRPREIRIAVDPPNQPND
jgi:hypothetical protein